jgi:hypothetical protein
MKAEERFLTDRRPENIFCATSQFCLNEDDSSAMSDVRATSMSSDGSSPLELAFAKNVLSQHVEHRTADGVVPRVGDHSGT